jgi:hypothetical protein
MALRISLTGAFEPLGSAVDVLTRPAPFVLDDVCAGIWIRKQQSKEVTTRARQTERMFDVS